MSLIPFWVQIPDIHPNKFILLLKNIWGYAVSQLVEALRYKPKGRGFDSRWSDWNFSLT